MVDLHKHLRAVMVEQFKPVLAKVTKLEDLRVIRESLVAKLSLVDEAIARHPDRSDKANTSPARIDIVR